MCFDLVGIQGRLCSCVGQPFLQNRKGGPQEGLQGRAGSRTGKSYSRFSEGFLPESLSLTLHPYSAVSSLLQPPLLEGTLTGGASGVQGSQDSHGGAWRDF